MTLQDGSFRLNRRHAQLNPTLLPTDTTDATTVTWKSSDEKVATVDKDGLVTVQWPEARRRLQPSTARPDVTAACTVKVPSILPVS